MATPPATMCRALLACGLSSTACLACAQGSRLTLYGSVDQYFSYLRSDAGATSKSLNDGAFFRSRWGLRSVEELGGGVSAKVHLEQSLSVNTGATDPARAFDREAWVGLSSSALGELRLGRQKTAVFNRGDYIDHTYRSLGSVVNAFGVPARYDNDIAYVSPRRAGVLAEVHLALGEAAGLRGQAVVQAALDYLGDRWRIGYAGLRGKAPAGAPEPADVRYDQLYANYNHGRGKLYAVLIRSNNSTSSGAGPTLINNGGAILGPVGGVVAGTNADVNRTYTVTQLSADCLVLPALRVGALWGRISDTSGSGRDAEGGSLGGYYALSRRTTLHASFHALRNKGNAGFRPSGSAPLSPTFTAAADVNGHRITGLAAGIVHRF